MTVARVEADRAGPIAESTNMLGDEPFRFFSVEELDTKHLDLLAVDDVLRADAVVDDAGEVAGLGGGGSNDDLLRLREVHSLVLRPVVHQVEFGRVERLHVAEEGVPAVQRHR